MMNLQSRTAAIPVFDCPVPCTLRVTHVPYGCVYIDVTQLTCAHARKITSQASTPASESTELINSKSIIKLGNVEFCDDSYPLTQIEGHLQITLLLAICSFNDERISKIAYLDHIYSNDHLCNSKTNNKLSFV